MNIPCEKCITLAICKAQIKQTDSVIILANKCSMITDFLRKPNPNGVSYSTEQLILIRKYFNLSEWRNPDPNEKRNTM